MHTMSVNENTANINICGQNSGKSVSRTRNEPSVTSPTTQPQSCKLILGQFPCGPLRRNREASVYAKELERKMTEARYAEVLSLGQSMKDDLAGLLDPETGFAPRIRQICREQ